MLPKKSVHLISPKTIHQDQEANLNVLNSRYVTYKVILNIFIKSLISLLFYFYK